MSNFDAQLQRTHHDSATRWRFAALSTLLSLAAACSTGGAHLPSSGGIVPPSNISNTIEPIEMPSTQDFVTTSGGGEIDDLAIRYDRETGQYFLQFDGYLDPHYTWHRLIDDPNSQPLPGAPNMSFIVDGLRNAYFLMRASYQSQEPDLQYRYSNLAAWSAFGIASHTAFGVATPTADIPRSGSGTYQGFIEGISTAPSTGWDNETVPAYVSGSVNLRFDFASGALTGAVQPVVHTDDPWTLGTIPLSGTIASGNYHPYWGQFDTPVAGENNFLGWFTGPAAEELIGGWNLPFVSPADGNVYSATGAWIAKKQETQP